MTDERISDEELADRERMFGGGLAYQWEMRLIAEVRCLRDENEELRKERAGLREYDMQAHHTTTAAWAGQTALRARVEELEREVRKIQAHSKRMR